MQASRLLGVQLSEEIIEESCEDWVSADCSKEPVSNSAAKGKVHRVIAHAQELHPRHWRTKCGWYFGRGMTSYMMHSEQPQGHACKVCFSLHRRPKEDAYHFYKFLIFHLLATQLSTRCRRVSICTIYMVK